jgi:hypothetical protein
VETEHDMTMQIAADVIPAAKVERLPAIARRPISL